jgi:hypothetical protein
MMGRTPGRSAALALIAVFCGAALADAQSPRSSTIAQQLTAALKGQKLDAIAARDPKEPDRFVAALYFPNSQLLVVSARYATPAALEAKLAQKQFRDIYLDLQGAPLPNTTIFYQDMNADGLCAERGQAADILYDGTPTPKIFDGDRGKQKVSEEDYTKQFTAADEQYSRMLNELLEEISAKAQN